MDTLPITVRFFPQNLEAVPISFFSTAKMAKFIPNIRPGREANYKRSNKSKREFCTYALFPAPSSIFCAFFSF